MLQGDEAGSSKCLKQQVSEKQEIHWWELLYEEWQGSRCYQDTIVCSKLLYWWLKEKINQEGVRESPKK